MDDIDIIGFFGYRCMECDFVFLFAKDINKRFEKVSCPRCGEHDVDLLWWWD